MAGGFACLLGLYDSVKMGGLRNPTALDSQQFLGHDLLDVILILFLI